LIEALQRQYDEINKETADRLIEEIVQKPQILG
jgi:hypothetical protein